MGYHRIETFTCDKCGHSEVFERYEVDDGPDISRYFDTGEEGLGPLLCYKNGCAVQGERPSGSFLNGGLTPEQRGRFNAAIERLDIALKPLTDSIEESNRITQEDLAIRINGRADSAKEE